MYNYSVYGLGISSELELPELLPSDEMGEVEIRLLYSNQADVTAPINSNFLKVGKTEAVLAIKSFGTIVIRSGKEISIYTNPKTNQLLLKRYIIGTVLAILLYQRGNLVLHASAIEINNRAIAFLGESGAGKSSIAAAFRSWGYGVISDDVSAIGFREDGTPIVYPGFPLLKLSAESAQQFGYRSELSTPIGGR